MNNEFTEAMSQRTDEELIKIVSADREKYKSIAIEAAELEIKKRDIDSNKFTEVSATAIVEKEKMQKVESDTVGSFIRFLNFLIDFIVWAMLVTIMSIVSEIFISSFSPLLVQFFPFIIILSTFLAYYIFMEIKFQKTIGKFVTKTKVVKLNGEKPEASDIISRSFYRLIPFDRISFLFVKNGIHDYLSKTKVIKDISE